MLYSRLTATEKRRKLRALVESGRPVVLPGAFNALSAKLIEDKNCAGVYLSGHMLAADLGLPDLGLTTLTEVATRARQIARMTDLPVLIDADTGFGEPMNAARTIQELEDAGVAGCHIEDQVNPKRCGQSDGVTVVDMSTALMRVEAATNARRDRDFLLIARTDARAVLDLDATIDRARCLVEAGADAIFPEVLQSRSEYAEFRQAIDVPLVINLNEFGRHEPFDMRDVGLLGYNVAIYPMTLMRLAMGAVERGVDQLTETGTQAGLISDMQPLERLYGLLNYDSYSSFDSRVFDRSTNGRNSSFS